MGRAERLVKAFIAWWQELGLNERRGLLAGSGFVLVVLVYLIAFQPAFQGRLGLLAALPGLRQQVAAMDLEAQEARRLEGQGTTQVPGGEALRDALAASLREHGLETKSLTQAGSGVRLELHDVAFADWIEWLDEARVQLHVKVSEAQVRALKPGQVDLTATLSPP
jgi:general secretion pathway protein M